MAEEKEHVTVEESIRRILIKKEIKKLEPERTDRFNQCQKCGIAQKCFKMWKNKKNGFVMYEIIDDLLSSLYMEKPDAKGENIAARIKTNKIYDRNVHGLVSNFLNKKYCIIYRKDEEIAVLNFTIPEKIIEVFVTKTRAILISKNFIFVYDYNKQTDYLYRIWKNEKIQYKTMHKIIENSETSDIIYTRLKLYKNYQDRNMAKF